MFSFFSKSIEDTIGVNELDKLIGTIDLIDIREHYEFTGGHIKTAKNIPMGELLAHADKYLDKDKKHYLMCQSGMRSSRTVNTLKKAGYQVINVKGGMGAYTGINRK